MQWEKNLRQTVLELESLSECISNPISIPLEKPIQRGWVRHYVLTKEAQKLPEEPLLRQILEVIGTKEYHWRRNFIPSRRRRRLVEIKQGLKKILADTWNSLPKEYPDDWRPFFHREFQQWSYGPYHYHRWFYVFSRPHLYELKVDRHWLTHLSIIDPLLIEREAELMEWMDQNRGWPRYYRLKGRNQHWRRNDDRGRKLEREAKSKVRDHLLQGKEADMKRNTHPFRISLFLLFPPRSPMQRHSAQNGDSAGANPAVGTTFALVAQ